MTKLFPKFDDHESARCFKCGRLLVGPRGSQYPRGEGGHRGECLSCGLHTYYDINTNTDEEPDSGIKKQS